MGASLGAPAKCLLCNELTQDPVALRCNHRFCHRCIGDLWSVSPTGPYHCPEWRCTTVYQTLPFDSSLIWPTASTSRRAQTRDSRAGTSNNGNQSKSDSFASRPSFTSRLLRKRKASTPGPEQPHTKRLSRDSMSERSSDLETASSSSSTKPESSYNAAAVGKGSNQVSTWSDGDGASSSSSHSDISAQPESDPPAEVSVNNNQPVVIADDSDGSDEVDVCNAPLHVTPTTPSDAPASRRNSLPRNSASPANSDPSTAQPSVSKPRPASKHAAAAAAKGSSQGTGVFARQESKRSSPVPCHYCPKPVYQSAVKTCLVCGASMCEEHLRPHVESPVFQNHTLVAPMEDISLWRCQEHQEINRIYCKHCAVCVCTVCTVIGSHRDHVCVSIREAERELRSNLKEEIKQLQLAEQQMKDRATQLTRKKETFSLVLTEAREGVLQQYGVIREALEQEEQAALQCVAQEESRVLKGLEETLGRLQSSLQDIQQGLHTLETLADAKGERRIQDQAFIMEYSSVSQLASGVGSVDQFEAVGEVNEARLNLLQKWTEKRLDTVVIHEPTRDRDLYRLLYGFVPSLDADTAHLKLQLSHDNRRVTYTESQQTYAEQEGRFSSFPQVLSCHALDAGRWYWEVNVSVDDGRWKVGLCQGQMERKGQKDSARLGFNVHSWCLACDRRRVEALHNKVSVPVAVDRLRRVGVFLDFGEGVLSFFNVTAEGSLALIHSYRHRFTGPLYPALSVSKTQLALSDLFQG